MLGQGYLPFTPILPNPGVDIVSGSRRDQWLVDGREATGREIVQSLFTIGSITRFKSKQLQTTETDRTDT